jgi:hypothetical protein
MSIEAMKLALFALDIVKIHYTQNRHINEAIAALKERLAQPEQEADELTIAYMSGLYDGKKAQRTEQEPDDIASIIACRNILDAQPVPPRRTEGKT